MYKLFFQHFLFRKIPVNTEESHNYSFIIYYRGNQKLGIKWSSILSSVFNLTYPYLSVLNSLPHICPKLCRLLSTSKYFGVLSYKLFFTVPADGFISRVNIKHFSLGICNL